MNLSAIVPLVAIGGVVGSSGCAARKTHRVKGILLRDLKGHSVRIDIGAENLRLTWASFAVYSVVPKPQVKG